MEAIAKRLSVGFFMRLAKPRVMRIFNPLDREASIGGVEGS
jgi:hypothetical protein